VAISNVDTARLRLARRSGRDRSYVVARRLPLCRLVVGTYGVAVLTHQAKVRLPTPFGGQTIGFFLASIYGTSGLCAAADVRACHLAHVVSAVPTAQTRYVFVEYFALDL